MGEWSKCLEDIEAAIEFFAYPLELSYKLLDRKAKCLIQLGRGWEAKEAFQQSLNHLGSATNLKPEKRESFGAEIKTEIDRLSFEKLEKPEKGYFVSNKDFNSKGIFSQFMMNAKTHSAKVLALSWERAPLKHFQQYLTTYKWLMSGPPTVNRDKPG